MNIERYYSKALRPFGQLNKPIKLINKKHLKWIRSRACVISSTEGDQIVAHHHQRRSQTQNDYLTIPLSDELHQDLHTVGIQTFEETHSVNLDEALIAQLVERIIHLESELKVR